MLTKEQLAILHDAKNKDKEIKSFDDVANILGMLLNELMEHHVDENGKLIITEAIKPTLSTVHWKQLLLNPYKFSIKLAMLMKDGYKVELTVGIQGEKKGKENAKLRNVVFDEDYVIEKIIREVVLPLAGMPDNLQVELFKKAQKLYNERMPKLAKASLIHQEKIESWKEIETENNNE